jgi:hypothetical protein
MEITLGALYDVHMDNGGRFVATADRFENDGNVVVLIPTQDPVRGVFPNGYALGSAHWAASLSRCKPTERKTGEDVSYEENRLAFVRGELEKLGESERYRLKLTSDNGETKWLSVTPETLAEVKAVLTRPADTAGQSEAGAEPTG